jgi:hypothetical protein
VALQEYNEGGSEDVEDAESIPSEDTDESSDDEDEEEGEGLEDDVDKDSDDDAGDQGRAVSEMHKSDSASGSESHSGEDSGQEEGGSDSDEVVQEDDMQENVAQQAQRGKQPGKNSCCTRRGEQSGVSRVKTVQNSAWNGAEGSRGSGKIQGGSGSKSGRSKDTRSKGGIASSSAPGSKARSLEGKSDSDLPQAMRKVCRSMSKRPQGAYKQQGSLSRSSRSRSRSKRLADAQQIENPWLSAAVAVGEGTVEDAMALADFVVAQPERDYDGLLRKRYWAT